MIQTYAVTAPTANTDLLGSILNFVEALPQYAIDIISKNIGLFSLFTFIWFGIWMFWFIKRMTSIGKNLPGGSASLGLNGLTKQQANIGSGLAMMGYSSSEISSLLKRGR